MFFDAVNAALGTAKSVLEDFFLLFGVHLSPMLLEVFVNLVGNQISNN